MAAGEYVKEWEGIGVYAGAYVEEDGQRVAQGAGRFQYANGDTYDGDWHAGQRHGQGVCTVGADGTRYTGAWVRDQMHGTGCVTAPLPHLKSLLRALLAPASPFDDRTCPRRWQGARVPRRLAVQGRVCRQQKARHGHSRVCRRLGVRRLLRGKQEARCGQTYKVLRG